MSRLKQALAGNHDGGCSQGLGLLLYPIHARPTGRTIFTGMCCEEHAAHVRGQFTRGCSSRDAGGTADQVPGRARWARCWFGHDANDGKTDELRSRSSKTQEGLGGKFSLEGHQARLQRGRSGPAARVGAHRAHAGAARCRETLEARQRAAVRQFARRDDGQPGDAAGEGRPEGDLSVGLAGGCRRQRRRRNVSGPIAVPDQLGTDGRETHQQHLRARRPDPAHGRQRRHRLLCADRRRRRSRFRRRAERVRIDEGDDRGRRGRRAFRRSAGGGEEMRSHGRQGARCRRAKRSKS